LVLFKNSSLPQTIKSKDISLENISMALSPVTQNQETFKSEDLVVGEGVVLNGILEVPNMALVSGVINGDLKVQSLIVGSTGKIEGKVDCQIADIAGDVRDDLRAHKLLVIRGTATLSGNIFYKDIEIEKGAKISGQLNLL
jgi:cytoskeletal protein CcmA (bactofilin family)